MKHRQRPLLSCLGVYGDWLIAIAYLIQRSNTLGSHLLRIFLAVVTTADRDGRTAVWLNVPRTSLGPCTAKMLPPTTGSRSKSEVKRRGCMRKSRILWIIFLFRTYSEGFHYGFPYIGAYSWPASNIQLAV